MIKYFDAPRYQLFLTVVNVLVLVFFFLMPQLLNYVGLYKIAIYAIVNKDIMASFKPSR